MRSFFNVLTFKIFLCVLVVAAQIAAIIFLCTLLPYFICLPAVVIFLYVCSFVTALHLLNSPSPFEYKCAWLALICGLPIVGCVIYFVTKTNVKPQPSPPLPSPQKYQRAIFFSDGAEYFSLLFKEIKRAQKFIYLEYYIFKEGTILSHLLTLLEEAKTRGVQICIIMDGFGCAKLKGRTVKRLKNCGQVVVFHKLCPLSPKNINCRDHRKIAAIDGVVAFTGGINIADEYANLSSPHGYWKDCGVAFYGQAAAAFADEFLYALNKNGVTKLDGSTNNLSLAIKAGQLLPIFDSPLSGGGLFEDVLSTLINRAQRGICICTPYLCVGDKLKSALIFAARRGVDVKIIIPATPDKKLTYMLTKNFASTLVAGGVEVYAYTPGFMHAKYFILDDCALVGSYNLDFRSMHLNCECAAMFANEALVSKVKADFNECLRLSSTFVPQKTNLATRVFNCILQLFAPLA